MTDESATPVAVAAKAAITALLAESAAGGNMPTMKEGDACQMCGWPGLVPSFPADDVRYGLTCTECGWGVRLPRPGMIRVYIAHHYASIMPGYVQVEMDMETIGDPASPIGPTHVYSTTILVPDGAAKLLYPVGSWHWLGGRL